VEKGAKVAGAFAVAMTARVTDERDGEMKRTRAAIAMAIAGVVVFAVASSAGLATGATAVPPTPPCFGGPPIGPACGTLSETNLHSLVSDMTLAQKVGMVHGQSETTDPQFGCGNTGLPTAFPVINPGATGSALVAGCVGQAGVNNGIKSLGVPPLRQTDGPAGVRLSHQETALPAPAGLTATFDRSAANLYGVVIGHEGRATNQDVLYAPMINQVTVPTAGRNFETLGEDPFLAGALVTDETLGVQSEGLIVTLKHLAENDFENSRTNTAVKLDERSLHELELQAFEAAVKNAHPGSIMCSYSRTSQSDTGFDTYSCGNNLLLNTIARGMFGFTGWVLTDFGAVHRLSDILGGVDSAMPNGNGAGIRDEPDPGNLSDPPFNNNVFAAGAGFPGGAPGSGKTLTQAVLNGTAAIPTNGNYPPVPATTGAQWSAALDTAVFHILTSMNRADLLEGTQYGSQSGGCTSAAGNCTPYVPARPDLQTLMAPDFSAAQKVAEESATLLKNDSHTLPLTSSDASGNGVLVVGPTATATYVGGGGSAHVTPFEPITSPLSALRAGVGSGTVNYVQGYDLDGQVVPSSATTVPAGTSVLAAGLPATDASFAGENGWLRQQISTVTPPSGSEPAACSGTCAPDQVDPTVDYTDDTSTLPAGTAWRWTTHFTVPAAPAGSNGWQLKVFVKNQSSAQLFVDGLASSARRINIAQYGVAAGGIGGSAIAAWDGLAQTAKSHDGLELQQAAFTATFAAGETHELDLRAYANGTDPLSVRFEWVPPDWQTQSIAAATSAGASANKVVIFAFDDGTEGVDRGGNDQNAGLELPGWQDALISAVAAVNPNVVVVLNTGDPVYMPWLASVKSVLEMWYPGEEGGLATADVLLGKTNPSGKLPMTFPDGSAARPRFPTDDLGCDPAAIVIPNNNTGLGANDGNCPLYPGVFMTDPVQGKHTYRTVDYTPNGIFQGYRWYDLHNVAPLFPFGYGLSYTSFGYSHLDVDPAADGGVDVSFDVKNTGSTTGAEVPQVYVGAPNDPPAGVSFAVRALAQFQRITLAPGQSQRVKLHVGLRRFTYWSTTDHRWILAGGPRTVFVGASSRDMKLQRAVNIAAPVLGSQAKGSEVDNDVAGQAEAFRNIAPIDGTLDHASVFVDRKSAATDLIVGLYADAGGHPGPLLARGDLTSPSGNDWNTVPLPTTTLSAGQPYWIALLGTGGTLRFRDECCGAKGSQPSESNALKKLTDLPATWSTGTVYRTDGPASAYTPLDPSVQGTP
jgi:beta-glucosidase